MHNVSNADLIRKYWPEWHIVKQLGHGSFGDVYDCEKADGVTEPTLFGADRQLSPGGMAVKHSAVKVIAIPQYDSQIAMMRAEGIPPEEIGPYYKKIAEDCVKEIKTMESLKSCPNVVYIEDFKVVKKEDGEGWVILIRMELLTSLPDYMQAHAMNEADILRLGIDICTALKVCHAKSIIHRDIKLGNIMVNEFGVFKLADFGIARELDKSEMGMSKKGTYSYMAPEMEMMDTYDHRVDLYALGIVLYQLLNRNRAPFLDPLAPSVSYEDKQRASMRRIMGEIFPPPLNGSEATKQAVMKACAYHAKDRFASADEMQHALQQALNRLNAAPTDDAPTEIGQPAHTPRQDGDETAFAAKPQPERTNRPSRQRDADATAYAGGIRADRNREPQPEGDKTVFNQQGRNRQTPSVGNAAPQAAQAVYNASLPTAPMQAAGKKKKTIIPLIAVLAVVIIAAVGFAISRLPHTNTKGGAAQNSGTTQSDSATQSDGATQSGGAAQSDAAATNDAAATQNAGMQTGYFKIGMIGPLSGYGKTYGDAVMNGAKLAVNEINNNGGIKIDFNPQDDEMNEEISVNAYNDLIDWGMQALIGPVTSSSACYIAEEAQIDRVFCMNPTASSTSVIEDNDITYQICFTDSYQGVASADYIAENFANAKVAVIYENDNLYSQGIRDTFAAEAAAKNLEIVYEGTFTDDTSADFSVQVTGAQSAKADVVFLPIYYYHACVILEQASDIGYAPTFFGVDAMDGILSKEGFDVSLAEGVMMLTPFADDTANAAAFTTAYRDVYGETPSWFAAQGYDAVYALYNALVAGGCTTDMTHEEICEKLIEEMVYLSYDGVTGKNMKWDSNGAVIKDPTVVVVKNGAFRAR